MNGARIAILPLGHSDLSADGRIFRQGVQQVIWGVDTAAALDDLRARLEQHVQLTWDGELARFVAPFGVAMGLRVWAPKPVICAPEIANAPGSAEQLNRPRRWRLKVA